MKNVSLNTMDRWYRLAEHLEIREGVELERFERGVASLGEAARRFVITCWERLGHAGIFASLRVVRTLRRAGWWLDGFRMVAGGKLVEAELRSTGGATRVVQLPPNVFYAKAALVEAMVQRALARTQAA